VKLPSLPTSIKNPQRYIRDSNFGISQKVDGHRLLIKVQERKLVGYNRQGDRRPVPTILNVLTRLPGTWWFDGELIKGEYYIFDLLQTPQGDTTGLPFEERDSILRNVLSVQRPALHYLPTHTQNKEEFFEYCQKTRTEGVVFKRLDAPYLQGRSKKQLKFKFVHTIDCIVTNSRLDDKDNLEIGLMSNGQIVNCGRVSALTGDGPKVNVGDVVEVTYLYTSKERHLYQPVRPKIRTDKKPEDCTVDQLELTYPSQKIIGELWQI